MDMNSISESNNKGLNITVKSSGFLINSFGKYLLCHATCFNGSFSRNDGHWGVPKGIVEGNDTLLETAIRETVEETGINIPMLVSKGNVVIYEDLLFRYRTTKKSVYVYYVESKIDLTLNTLKCTSRITGSHLPENDAFCWVDWNTAREMVSKRQKELFSDENLKKIVDRT